MSRTRIKKGYQLVKKFLNFAMKFLIKCMSKTKKCEKFPYIQI